MWFSWINRYFFSLLSFLSVPHSILVHILLLNANYLRPWWVKNSDKYETHINARVQVFCSLQSTGLVTGKGITMKVRCLSTNVQIQYFTGGNQVEKTPPCAQSSNAEVFQQPLKMKCKGKLSCTPLKLPPPEAPALAITENLKMGIMSLLFMSNSLHLHFNYFTAALKNIC